MRTYDATRVTRLQHDDHSLIYILLKNIDKDGSGGVFNGRRIFKICPMILYIVIYTLDALIMPKVQQALPHE